jgi:hypothetical protein
VAIATLACLLWNVPVAAGAEPVRVLDTGTRLVRAAALGEAGAPAGTGGWRRDKAERTRAEGAGQQSSGLSQSGLSRGRKLLIGALVAGAFAAAVVAIDRGVEDNTPSSRGLR